MHGYVNTSPWNASWIGWLLFDHQDPKEQDRELAARASKSFRLANPAQPWNGSAHSIASTDACVRICWFICCKLWMKDLKQKHGLLSFYLQPMRLSPTGTARGQLRFYGARDSSTPTSNPTTGTDAIQICHGRQFFLPPEVKESQNARSSSLFFNAGLVTTLSLKRWTTSASGWGQRWDSERPISWSWLIWKSNTLAYIERERGIGRLCELWVDCHGLVGCNSTLLISSLIHIHTMLVYR